MQFGETVINKNFTDVNPIQYGYEECENRHSFGPAVRDYWLLHFVVSGKGEFTRGNNRYSLKSGDIFVIRPYEETYYEADSVEPWTYIWIGFTVSDKIGLALGDVIHAPKARAIFEEIKKCIEIDVGKPEFLCGQIWCLLSLLNSGKTENYNYTQKALDIIHAKFGSHLTVDDIAKTLNLERTYFSKIFKEETGLSPKQYLVKYRMEKAASFLKDYGYSVSVTAASVGYSDVYIFSKMFKSFYGKSPSDFIKK